MNYLAHAWVLPAGSSPARVLGCALPDLLSAYDRRAPRLTAPIARALGGELGRGVLAHAVADACFHELPAFRDGCSELRPLADDLRQKGARVRGFFLAHVLLEILLDACVLERGAGLAYYEALGGADLE